MTKKVSLNRKGWSKAILKTAQEFPLTPLPILSGKIPENLQGTLYRNGTGRLERGGERVGHWFDGDGAILAVNFSKTGATATYRYVQTEGYQKESQSDKFIFPNYGKTKPIWFWDAWGKAFKNTANTSVLALPDKLLALWEAGFPHALDLQTLETFGLDNLDSLNENEVFSAHPKIDFQTGEIFNFGVTLGTKITLNLYRSNGTGKIIKKGTHPLKRLSIIHDFVLAGSYLIFFIPPLSLNVLPALLGLQSFSDAMQWKSQLGTQILIFDRHTLSLVSRGEAEAWYQWHYANGYVDKDDSIVVEFIRFPDFQTNQNLKEVATGETHTYAKGTLWKIRLNPKNCQILEAEELLNNRTEFPIVPPHQVGQNWRYTYLSCDHSQANIEQEILGNIARFDRQSKQIIMTDMGENCYPSEPIFVPDSLRSEKGWVLTVVYDGNIEGSEVRIYESDRLDFEPICRLELPGIIPPSFHGTWKQAVIY